MGRTITGIVTGLLFAGFTYLVKTYDVAAIGPGGAEVGFATVNGRVHELTGVNDMWYEITDMLGYLAIAVAALFALVGLVQMIKRRSLLKVDREIIALGVLFVVVIGCYVLFEKFVINCRPVLMPGDLYPEPSYPSSHTMLTIVVMGAAMALIRHYMDKGFLRGLLCLLCAAVIIVTVGGRLYCGYHWFTDIIGGLLLSCTLLAFYTAFIHSGSKEPAYHAKH